MGRRWQPPGGGRDPVTAAAFNQATPARAAGLTAVPRDRAFALLAALALFLTGALLASDGAWPSLGLLAVSAVLGAIFLAVEFGYTSSYRAWLGRGDGSGMVAGLLVAAVAALFIIPVGSLVDGYGGWVWPIGLPVIGGAALFGLGMQLANGCGSGCLYKAGGGSPSLLIALPFFCLGGLLGSLILPAALALPAIPAIGFSDLLGTWAGLAADLAIIAALALFLLRRGPRPTWKKLRAAVAIGVLAGVAFLLSGQPWGITMGLTIWGAKAATALGVDLSQTVFWSWDGPRAALHGSLLADDSSLMNIGMLLGAALLAAWRGSLRGQQWPGLRVATAAAIGGVLMGVGARLSFGCNIGALVGGIASGSLHGFAWFLAAIPGSLLGMKLRPWFGLARV
jgi:uncharacterized membrane protein YedE/YeeE